MWGENPCIQEVSDVPGAGSSVFEILWAGNSQNDCYFSVASALGHKYYYVLALSVDNVQDTRIAVLLVNRDTLGIVTQQILTQWNYPPFLESSAHWFLFVYRFCLSICESSLFQFIFPFVICLVMLEISNPAILKLLGISFLSLLPLVRMAH